MPVEKMPVEMPTAAPRTFLPRFLAPFVIALVLLVAECNSGGSATRPPAASRTPAASPTATTPALTGVTPGPEVASACAGPAGSPLSIGEVHVGVYDSWQVLPGDLPLKPEPIAVAKVSGNIALSTITVDVALGVPAASAPGYLCAVTARIVAYQPFATPIPNVTRACSDHAYLDPGGPDYGGDCGATPGPPASAAIAFPSSATGTTVSVPIQNAQAPGHPAAFPPPGAQASHVTVTLKVRASGAYTIAIGLWQDASGPRATLAVNEKFDLDAVHHWSGDACTLPAMQALLPPATNPPTSLLCPGPPPLQ